MRVRGRSVNASVKECESTYHQIMQLVHDYVPRTFKAAALASASGQDAPSEVLTTNLISKFSKVVDDAVKASDEQNVRAEFDAMSTPFVREISKGWSHEKRKRILRIQQMHQGTAAVVPQDLGQRTVAGAAVHYC